MPIYHDRGLTENPLLGNVYYRVGVTNIPRNVDSVGDYLYFLVVHPWGTAGSPVSEVGTDTHRFDSAVKAFEYAARRVLDRHVDVAKHGRSQWGKVRVLGIGLEGYTNLWSDQEIRELVTSIPRWREKGDEYLGELGFAGSLDLTK